MRRLLAALLIVAMLLGTGYALAEGPRAVERIRFADAGISLELPMHWMYMDITDSFQGEDGEPILMYGEPVTITCYAMLADAAQSMSVNIIALKNEDRLDAQWEFDSVVEHYGDLAEIRTVDGHEVCVYPYEDGGMAAVTYTDDNLITLYGNLGTGSGGREATPGVFLRDFLAMVNSMRFHAVTE